MEPEILKKLQEQESKIEAIYRSVEKTRNYIKWTIIASVILFLLPLVGMIFALPAFFQAMNATSLMGL